MPAKSNPATVCTPLVYTMPEAADLIRGSRTTLNRAIAAGQLRQISRGRNRYIPAAALAEWVDRGMPTHTETLESRDPFPAD